MKAIEEIIGSEDAECLRSEFNDIVMNGDVTQIEDLLLGYGLEMDYVEQLMW